MRHDPYLAAKKRVKQKKSFYGHLSAYIPVNVVMFFVVLLTDGGFGWLGPASMWGIGLTIHYFSVFGFPGVGAFGSKEWEEKEIEKELAKDGYELPDPIENEELELKEFKKLNKEYRDDDLV